MTFVLMIYAMSAVADDMIMIIRLKFENSTPENGHVIFKSDYPTVIKLGNDAYLSWELNDKTLTDIKILVNGSVVSTNTTGTYVTRPAMDTSIKVALFDVVSSKVVEEHEHHIKVVANPTIDSFTADKTSVSAGEEVNFLWAATNMSVASISPSVTMTGANSAKVNVDDTTTFTLTVENELGNKVTEDLVIDVVPVAPTVKSFTSTTNSVYRDDFLTFNWEVEDSDHADIYANGTWYRDLPVSGSLDIKMSILGNINVSIRGVDAKGGEGAIQSLTIEVLESIDWNIKPQLVNAGSVKFGQSIDVEWEMGPTLRDLTAKYQTNVDSSWQSVSIDKSSGLLSFAVNDPSLRLINLKFIGERLNGTFVEEYVIGSVVNVEINAIDAAVGTSILMNVESGKSESLFVYSNNIYLKQIGNGVNFIDVKYSGSNKIEVRKTTSAATTLFSFDVYGLPDWVAKPAASHAVATPGEEVELSWTAVSPFEKVSIERTSELGSQVFDNLELSATYSAGNRFKTSLVDGEGRVKYRFKAHTAAGSVITHDVYVYMNNVKLSSKVIAFGEPLVFDVTMGIGDIAFYVEGVKFKQIASTGSKMTVSIDAIPLGYQDIRVASTTTISGAKTIWEDRIEVYDPGKLKIMADYHLAPVGSGLNVAWTTPAGFTSPQVYSIDSDGNREEISTNANGSYAFVLPDVNSIRFYVEAFNASGVKQTSLNTVYQTKSYPVNSNQLFDQDIWIYHEKIHTASSTYKTWVNGKYVGSTSLSSAIAVGDKGKSVIDKSFFPSPGTYIIKVLESKSVIAEFKEQIIELTILPPVDYSLNYVNYENIQFGENASYYWEIPLVYTKVRAHYREDNKEIQFVSNSSYGSFTMPNTSTIQAAELYVEIETDTGFATTVRMRSTALKVSLSATSIAPDATNKGITVFHDSYLYAAKNFNIYVDGVKIFSNQKGSSTYIPSSYLPKGKREIKVETNNWGTKKVFTQYVDVL
jgi:hypothetical protein